MLTLGFLAVFSEEKKISRKEALGFSLTHLGHKMELREKKISSFQMLLPC